jgi:hypothetical protein
MKANIYYQVILIGIIISYFVVGCKSRPLECPLSQEYLTFPPPRVMDNIRSNIEYYTVFCPQWRVTELWGAKIAEPRSIQTFLGQSKASKVSIRIRYSPYITGHPSWTTDCVSFVDLTEAHHDNVNVKIWRNEARWYDSIVILACKGLYFEVMESSSQVKREGTERALNSLIMLCRQLEKYKDISAIRAAYARTNLTDGECLVMEQLHQRGIYRVSGYVNPQQEGFIQVRLFRKSGEELSALKASRSLEYIGWSADKRERFYFESEMTIDGNGQNENVRVAICFQPRYERELFNVETNVSTWVR